MTTLFAMSFLSGNLGQIGPDGDDKMRLVQLRDLYHGQNWFDLTQTRMGFEGGTLMHWSRIVDLPIVCLIALFDIALPYSTAEQFAISIWPPLSSGLVIWGVVMGAKHVGGKNTLLFAMIMLLPWLVGLPRFLPGAIDHHNLQLGLLALIIGYALDPMMRARSYVIAGICLALSLAIGVEVYAFAAILCTFFAFNWVVNDTLAKRGTIAFGISFGLSLLVIFIATISPENYAVISCDSYSFIFLAAGGIGGLGLALSAYKLSGKTLAVKLFGLAALAAVCGLVLSRFAPQCLVNPLDSLPSSVRGLWLGSVSEAQPLFKDKNTWFILAPYALGVPFVALIVTGVRIWQKSRTAENLMLFVLLSAAILLTVYQIRFKIFGILFALFVLPGWINTVYVESRKISSTSLKYMLALVVSVPIFWVLPGKYLAPAQALKMENIELADQDTCYSDAVLQAINTLPTGLFSIPTNGGVVLLLGTNHHVLSGNYHRNYRGIQAQIEIMTQPPEQAYETMLLAKVDYLFYCQNSRESLVDYAPNGLEAALRGPNTPSFLSPIGPKLENGNVTIYGVKQR